jgi:chromosome partitioning protein
MDVIALVSTKGGVGKSTIAESIAVEAVKEGRQVYLLDLDPQKSTANWWKRRGGPENPMLVVGVDAASKAIKAIRDKKVERDLMVIDTPGSFLGVINDALGEAHCIVIVTQPSAKDIEAQGAVEGLIQKLNRIQDTLYVVNRVDGRSSLGQLAIAAIRPRTVRDPMIIGDRADYVRADAVGKVANEVNAKASEEISALWEALKGIINEHKEARQPAGRVAVG